MFVLKKANPSHKSFIAIAEKTFIKTHGPYAYWKKSVLNYFWRHKAFNSFIAEYDNKPVAYVILMYNENAWHLDTVYTLPAFRRKGIMKKLLTEAISQTKKKYIMTEINALNLKNDKRSDGFLVSFGFEVVSDDDSLYEGRGGKKLKLSLT